MAEPLEQPATNGTHNTGDGDGDGDGNGRSKSLNGHEARMPSTTALALTEYSADPKHNGNGNGSANGKGVRDLVPPEFMLPNGHPDYLRLILTSKVYEVCQETSLQPAVNLSNRLECTVLLKREDEHPVFSFKLRGAYNKMAHLRPDESWRGVVCCSAGNHAQGVAYSARKLRIPATIIMPEGTPAIKHLNVSRMGGHVVLHGPDFDAAKEECARRELQDHLINIPPFDDPYVIAGQGTIGMELVRQTNLQKLEAIFCCVGGGGLLAGVGLYVKRIAPHVKVIGVETYDADALAQSLAKGERVTLSEVGLFADGAAVKQVGEETFRICQDVVDQVIHVTTDETCAAIKDVFEDTRSIVEPAGALALAGLKKYVAANPSVDPARSLVAITSGANMNFDRLRFVAERANVGAGKEVLLSCHIPERPGSFAKLIAAIQPQAVTEFSYRYTASSGANVLLGLSLVAAASQRSQELGGLMHRIRSIGSDLDHGQGFTVTDLSGDELAKTHVRYLVGGPSDVPHERLYMFNFPERLGALDKFLTTLRPKYNISLFQYRNSGGDIAKVLAGILCPEGEVAELDIFLNEIGYSWTDCTDSPVFKTFLRS